MIDRDLRAFREPELVCSIAAAVIGGVATVASGAISATAAGGAAKTAQQTAQQNNALQSQIFGQNKGELQPFIDRGNTAGSAENALLGLGGDTGAANAAFNNYLNSTGYNFQLGQGVNAISGSRAAAGTLDSGGTLKALDTYGQGLASNYFGNYMNSLNGVSNSGLSAAGSLAGVGQNYANAVSANNNSAGSATANAGLSTASSLSGLLGNAFNAYALNQGTSSYKPGYQPPSGLGGPTPPSLNGLF